MPSRRLTIAAAIQLLRCAKGKRLLPATSGEQPTRKPGRRAADTLTADASRAWLRTFPNQFFQEIYRLQGWDYKPGTSKRTPYVGQLPPGVLDELRRLNPPAERGYRAHKHFQFLTGDTGNASGPPDRGGHYPPADRQH